MTLRAADFESSGNVFPQAGGIEQRKLASEAPSRPRAVVHPRILSLELAREFLLGARAAVEDCIGEYANKSRHAPSRGENEPVDATPIIKIIWCDALPRQRNPAGRSTAHRGGGVRSLICVMRGGTANSRGFWRCATFACAIARPPSASPGR